VAGRCLQVEIGCTRAASGLFPRNYTASMASRATSIQMDVKARNGTCPRTRAIEQFIQRTFCDTKKAIVLALLRRKEGATTTEIAKATDWQSHTIRGFISGMITKKMGLAVESAKNEAGERRYRITA